MRPEDFDKQLQQKLDDLNPVFNEKDWIRLYNKMEKDRTPVYFSKRNVIILLLLCLGLAGSWIAFHWNSPKINTDIKKESPAEQKSPIMAQEKNPDSEMNTTTSSISNQPELSSYKKSSLNPSVSTAIMNHKNSIDNINDNNSIQKNQKNSSKIKTFNQPSSKIHINLSGSSETNVQIDNSNVASDQSGIQNMSEKSSDISQVSVSDQKAIADVNILHPDLVSAFEPVEILPLSPIVSARSLQKAHIKPIAGIKASKWIVGVTGLYTKTHLNTGVAFEIKTNKNISFGSGLIVQNYFKQNYVDQNAFSATNEANFTDLIRPRHSNSVSYTNIQIRSQDVILPLILKYYHPLSLKYALFASAGLQLTLSSKTSVDFNYLPYDTNVVMKETDLNQASNSATLINNFVVNTGIQREFGKLVLQTSFTLQKNNSNQPQISKLDPAGQLGIFYKL